MTELHTSAVEQDRTPDLLAAVQAAVAAGQPLQIVGGGSKAAYGRPGTGEPIALAGHCGIVAYDPAELVVSVRAGTPLRVVSAALAAEGQMLAFEPAEYDGRATVGGMVACGLSGPRRPWVGAVRDFVLGCRLISGEGKLLRFGGEVMKNVAGYDVSRLITGSLGCLGLITEVSFKVLPLPRLQASLRLELSLDEALDRLAHWGQQPLPLAGACHDGEGLWLRLEGGESSVQAACAQLGGERVEADFWRRLREQELEFFRSPLPLWRLSVAPDSRPQFSGLHPGQQLADWGGAQRWLKTDAEPAQLRTLAAAAGGHASCFTAGVVDSPFHPLPAPLLHYHQQLKARLDPLRIFNRGRMYAEL